MVVANKKPGLVLLSFGAGQDSAALLHLYLNDAAFREKYVGERDLIAIFSDTHDEHTDTMEYLNSEAKRICEKQHIPFFHLEGWMGYHTGHWAKGLHGMWEATKTIGSVAFPTVCSPRLKTDPIYNFLAKYVRETYGYDLPGKKPLEAFAAERGKIEVWIGYTVGEETRVPDDPRQLDMGIFKKRSLYAKWRENAIALRFPLIELGFDRAACQEYVRKLGEKVPPPSQCFSCMWKSPIELLWSARTDPARFAKWIEAERRKLDAWANEDFRRARQKPEDFKPNAEYKNLGVLGKGEFKKGIFVAYTLQDALADAEIKYADWTMEQLNDYRNSHGHCMTFKRAA